MDSGNFVFLIGNMSEGEKEKLYFPFKTLITLDNNGVLGTPFGCWETGRSPLTSEGYRVRAVFRHRVGRRHVLVGYEMELNPPACIIGNNMLLVNSVYKAGFVALNLLRYWLAEQGGSKDVIDSFSIINAEIKSVTLTYLINCLDNAGAHVARKNMYSHGATLHNKKYRAKVLKKSPVYKVGPDESATVYMNHHDYKISCYVKDRVVCGASSNFATPEIEAELRAEASKYLRVEIKLNEAWLIEHGLQSIHSWRYIKERSPYNIGIETIRSYLRLDDDLRTRTPKPEYLEKLSEEEKKMLGWHLDGKNVRKHVSLRGSHSHKFYPIRQRLMKKVRVDLSIPWESQNNDLCPQLSGLLKIEGQYKPPKKIAEHVYCRRAIKVALSTLKELVAKRLNESSKEG